MFSLNVIYYCIYLFFQVQMYTGDEIKKNKKPEYKRLQQQMDEYKLKIIEVINRILKKKTQK